MGSGEGRALRKPRHWLAHWQAHWQAHWLAVMASSDVKHTGKQCGEIQSHEAVCELNKNKGLPQVQELNISAPPVNMSCIRCRQDFFVSFVGVVFRVGQEGWGYDLEAPSPCSPCSPCSSALTFVAMKQSEA